MKNWYPRSLGIPFSIFSSTCSYPSIDETESCSGQITFRKVFYLIHKWCFVNKMNCKVDPGWIMKLFDRSILTVFLPISSFTENDLYPLPDNFFDSWDFEYRYVNNVLFIHNFQSILYLGISFLLMFRLPILSLILCKENLTSFNEQGSFFLNSVTCYTAISIPHIKSKGRLGYTFNPVLMETFPSLPKLQNYTKFLCTQ